MASYQARRLVGRAAITGTADAHGTAAVADPLQRLSDERRGLALCQPSAEAPARAARAALRAAAAQAALTASDELRA